MTGEPVSAIRNLGPRSVEMFAKAGIHTADQIRDLGPDEAYRRMIAAGNRPHFIGYYVMVMGLQGRPWNDMDVEEKARLRDRFDAIVASTQNGATAIEAELNRLGVVEKPATRR